MLLCSYSVVSEPEEEDLQDRTGKEQDTKDSCLAFKTN